MTTPKPFNFIYLCALRRFGPSIWAAPDDWTPITVKPHYVFRDLKIIERDVRTIEKRLGKRMVAGRMAIPFLRRALGAVGPLPREIGRLSLNQMAEFVLADAGQSDADNL